MMQQHKPAPRSGFSLLEVVFSVALLGTIMMLTGLVSTTGQNAYQGTSAASALNAKVKLTIDRIAMEMQLASVGTFVPTLDGVVTDTSVISFQQLVDIQDGVPVYGGPTPDEVMAIQFLIGAGEVADGADNNGNGLVDEMRVVLVRDVGTALQSRVTLCNDVSSLLEGEVLGGGDENGNGLTDEGGFVLERNGEVLTIRLSLEGVSADGVVLVRTGETAIRLRN